MIQLGDAPTENSYRSKTKDLVKWLRASQQDDPNASAEPGWGGLLVIDSCRVKKVKNDFSNKSQEDRELLAQGPCILLSSKNPAPAPIANDNVEEILRYLGICKTKNEIPTANQLFLHISETNGDSATMIGGELTAPLIAHAPLPWMTLSAPLHQQQGNHPQKSGNKYQPRQRLSGSKQDIEKLKSTTSPNEEFLPDIKQEMSRDQKQRFNMLVKQVYKQDIAAINAILESDPNLKTIVAQAMQGKTILHWACAVNKPKAIDALIQAGCDVNGTDKQGRTPLHIACETESFHSMEALLKYGAKTEIADSKGNTPLMAACSQGNSEVIQLLLNHKANLEATDPLGYTPFVRATHEDKVEKMGMLKNRGANIDAKDKYGNTPLLYICSRNKGNAYAMAQRLLEWGADVTATSGPKKYTPLMIACLKGNKELVKLLLTHNADKGVKSEDGKTAYELAAKFPEIQELLTQQGHC